MQPLLYSSKLAHVASEHQATPLGLTSPGSQPCKPNCTLSIQLTCTSSTGSSKSEEKFPSAAKSPGTTTEQLTLSGSRPAACNAVATNSELFKKCSQKQKQSAGTANQKYAS